MEHYNEDYFQWQREKGMYGAKLNKFLFEDFLDSNKSVVDFGCGGGFLLNEINAKEKLGIEINESGRANAESLGVSTLPSIDEVEDRWADVVISNHVLEHVDHPLETIRKLRTKLKDGGKMVFVTPFERTNSYKKDDINYHLYTWSPMNLGNLFHRAGLEIIEVQKISHKWPPYYDKMITLFGYRTTNLMCSIYGHLNRSQTQVRIVAEKK
jgi:SAM-dependent methyltransferase